MTKVVLQAFVILCCVRGSLVRAAPLPVATCKLHETTVTEIAKQTRVQVRCPQGHDLRPALKDPPVVYANDGSDLKEVELRQRLPGATLRANGASMDLHVVQLPPSSASVFFQCRGGTPQKETACFIHVRVAAGPPLGPNTCAAPGSYINLKLKNVGEAARFTCGETLSLIPKGGQIFDASCQNPMPIPEGLALTTDNNMYSFTLKSAMQSAKFCFACLFGDENLQAHRCEVRIDVDPAQGGVGRRDLSLSAGTAAAFCLLIASLSFLHGS